MNNAITTLTATDLATLKSAGVSLPVVSEAQVRRVSHEEARDLCGIRYKSEHLEGIAFPYLDPEDGRIVTWRVRRDHPEVENDGTPIAKYVSPPDRKHLYFVPGCFSQLADTSSPVIVVEAEKSVLAIAETRLSENRTPRPLIIGTGGCWGWRGVIGKATSADGARVDQKGPIPDLDRITWTSRATIIVLMRTSRQIRMCKRPDGPFAAELAKRGAKVRIVELPGEDGVNGPDDYIGKHGAAAFFGLINTAQPVDAPTDDSGEGTGRPSQATRIVDLLVKAGADLWHTPNGDAYVSIKRNGHREHYPLASRASRDYLSRLFYRNVGKAPSSSAMQDAIATLSGLARFDGAEQACPCRRPR